MKASDLFVKALENEGVEYIFAVPGEENIDLLNSIKESSIKLVLTRHEQGAGFMAATYGRLTGKPGVCMATLGPGATNLVTPTAYAQLGAMPMMLITGQKPIKTSKQARFQILDVVDMLQPLTKFTKQIVNGNTIPSLVRECFRLAVEERPGAVHVRVRGRDVDEAAVSGVLELVPIHEFGRDVGDHRGLFRPRMRAVVLEQVVDEFRDRLVPHPFYRVDRPVLVQSSSDLPKMGDVAAMGVHVDDAVDPVVGEVPREALDVVAEGGRVDPHRPVELSVMRADADVHRGCAEVAGSFGRLAGERLRDEVVGRERQVWTVLLGGAERDDRDRLVRDVLAEFRPGVICDVHGCR